MREIDTAVVEEAVLHRIERSQDGPVVVTVSEASIRADADEPAVLEYLGTHIVSSTGDHSAIAANVGDPALPVAHALELSLDSDQFLSASQDLARQLYERIQADGRISDGTLAVARYRPVRDGVAGPTGVAVMKLDPSVQFTVEEEQTDQGVRITLRPVDSVLPSVRERLQKAAVIRPTDGDEYRMLVLDRQTRGDGVATWFMVDYLGAVPAATDQTRTEGFYRAVVLIGQELEDELSEHDRRRIAAARDQALRDATVDTQRWVENRWELTDEQRTRAEAVLDRELTDREFVVHRETAERLLRRARFDGEDGLVITISAEFEARVGEVEVDPNTDERFVRIRTSYLERKR